MKTIDERAVEAAEKLIHEYPKHWWDAIPIDRRSHYDDVYYKACHERERVSDLITKAYADLQPIIDAAQRAEELEQAIKDALKHSNGRYSEWGERAEECFHILRLVLLNTQPTKET